MKLENAATVENLAVEEYIKSYAPMKKFGFALGVTELNTLICITKYFEDTETPKINKIGLIF